MTLRLRDSSSFSSVPSSTSSYEYEVFLSFRGKDTRHGFTGHLYNYLIQRGFDTFIDDNELPRGEEISQALLRAIEESKLSLIVFSENYAFSKWCLDELVHILKCRRSMNQMVHPIFYKVDPSDVRHQRGKYAEALAKHELRFDHGTVARWRAALKEATDLSGSHFSGHGYEYEFIGKIVRDISSRVKKGTKLNMPECQVGLDSRLGYVLEILDVEANDVRMVGIWGIGGVGKTTIAKAVYNEIAHKFDGCCFLADVRKGSEQHGGLVKLQNTILSSIVGLKEFTVCNDDEGITILRKTLRHKRILLVVDDVDSPDQLEKLAGRTDWFGHGSRVIITTRDERLLLSHGVSESQIYKAWELNHNDACEFFSAKAKVDNANLNDDEKLIVTTVVKYARGIPLALEVLGSYICDTSIHEWPAMLDGFRKDPPKCIQDILTVSYDGLQVSVKNVFLDIACFFKGWKRNEVIQILKGCDRFNPEYSIKLLQQKALIHVGRNCDSHIQMHDLLEEMGKVKVLQESTEPGKRSRLWHYKDVQDVLTENRGTSKIEGIMVKMPKANMIRLHPKCFKKMENLKIFINVNGRFVGKVDYYPNQLRVVDWPECPLQSLPSNFDTKKMIHLNMRGSRISSLGKGFKSMQNLTSLKLRACKFLTEFPDVSGSPNIEFLDLRWCSNLVEVHPSVGFLEKLVELDFYECRNLVKLPGKVNWRSLQELDLDCCSSLESFPEIVGEMKYMTSLSLLNTGIKALPPSIRYMINLEQLNLQCCNNLTDLPCSIYELPKLGAVELFGCPNLVTFPNKKVSRDDGHSLSGCSSSIDNLALPLYSFTLSECGLSVTDCLDCASTLESLTLSGMNWVVLPECIKEVVNLRNLDLSYYTRLVEIRELPPRIEKLGVRGCVSLERISKLSNILERKETQMIKEMDLTDCWRLCRNSVHQMVNEEENELDADLFCQLLCSQLSQFTIRFPLPRIGVPKWFSCQMDYKGYNRFEFWIEALPNFKWDNTGLALCVVDQLVQGSRYGSFGFNIYIDEVQVSNKNPHRVDSGNAWVHYVPFREMWRFDYRRPLPPFTCRVLIFQQSDPNGQSIKSCGVHLVMPPSEDVCMQLIRAENLHSRFSVDERFKKNNSWEKYGPKQGECSAHT